MSSPIPLFRCAVAGVSYRQDAVKKTNSGNTIRLEPEPNNEYDPNAIKVIVSWEGVDRKTRGPIAIREQVGYIPNREGCALASLIKKHFSDEWIARLNGLVLWAGGENNGCRSRGLRIRIWDPTRIREMKETLALQAFKLELKTLLESQTPLVGIE